MVISFLRGFTTYYFYYFFAAYILEKFDCKLRVDLAIVVREDQTILVTGPTSGTGRLISRHPAAC